MQERPRYSSTSFRVGVLAAIIGIAFVVVGSGLPGENPFDSPAFIVGLGFVLAGGGIIAWALRSRPS